MLIVSIQFVEKNIDHYTTIYTLQYYTCINKIFEDFRAVTITLQFVYCSEVEWRLRGSSDSNCENCIKAKALVSSSHQLVVASSSGRLSSRQKYWTRVFDQKLSDKCILFSFPCLQKHNLPSTFIFFIYLLLTFVFNFDWDSFIYFS